MSSNYKKILLIQTAFIGDVILATSMVETLHRALPESLIDMVVRRGNESLLQGHPHLNKVWSWDKKEHKWTSLLNLIQAVRRQQYDVVINMQRFFATGLLTVLSGAHLKHGFKKNPLSFAFTRAFDHPISERGTLHEIERNRLLLKGLIDDEIKSLKPALYPGESDRARVRPYQKAPYYLIAPGSVWFTKRYPKSKWVELTTMLPGRHSVYFIGSADDYQLSEEIILESGCTKCVNLCGQLRLLESAALMEGAQRCFVNDSAPMHLASAVNAPVSAIFCSTVPAFGFGPLSDDSTIVQAEQELACRPCGLHGKNRCPEGHFDCGYLIDNQKIIKDIG